MRVCGTVGASGRTKSSALLVHDRRAVVSEVWKATSRNAREETKEMAGVEGETMALRVDEERRLVSAIDVVAAACGMDKRSAKQRLRKIRKADAKVEELPTMLVGARETPAVGTRAQLLHLLEHIAVPKRVAFLEKYMDELAILEERADPPKEVDPKVGTEWINNLTTATVLSMDEAEASLQVNEGCLAKGLLKELETIFSMQFIVQHSHRLTHDNTARHIMYVCKYHGMPSTSDVEETLGKRRRMGQFSNKCGCKCSLTVKVDKDGYAISLARFRYVHNHPPSQVLENSQRKYHSCRLQEKCASLTEFIHNAIVHCIDERLDELGTLHADLESMAHRVQFLTVASRRLDGNDVHASLGQP